MAWASPGRHNNSLGESVLLFLLLNSPGNLKSANARTAEFERSLSGFVIIFLLLVKRERLTFLDELSRQIRLHDIDKLLLSGCLSDELMVIDARSKRSSCSRRCIFLQPKLKERVAQFLLRLLPFDPRSSTSLLPLRIRGLGQSSPIDFPL